MRYGMVVDLDRCIGCRTCAVICKDHNARYLKACGGTVCLFLVLLSMEHR